MTVQILTGDNRDILRTLPADSVQTCVTSPPYYGLRDYGHDGQIGMEDTPDAYIAQLVDVFREVRRVLKTDGTAWVNIGDSYSANGGQHGGRTDNQAGVGAKRTHDAGGGDQAPRRAAIGTKPKDLIGIPWMLAFALRADGWYLRQDIIWHKPNPMPESVTDRCTKAHEYIFLLSKSERYHCDMAAIGEPAIYPGEQLGIVRGTKRRASGMNVAPSGNEKPGADAYGGETRNRRSVWTVPTAQYSGAHFATFPPALIEPCILAGSRPGDVVLDPFGGAGTTGLVADRLGRDAILVELNPEYAAMARARIKGDSPLFAQVSA